MSGPSIERSLQLKFIGDWGQANFHRICSWLAQEFCDRAGRRSQVAILNLRDGGIEALQAVQDGEAHMCIATPDRFMSEALVGRGIFAKRPLPNLRALGVLPQDDRMLFAVGPELNVASFEDIRRRKLPLKIATSVDDGTNFIGYVAMRMMEAHGIDEATLNSWGGSYVTRTRPEQVLALMRSGEVNAVVQEAIMTPWWADVMNRCGAKLIPPETEVLTKLSEVSGLRIGSLRAGYWASLTETISVVDFSDFVLLVRDDLPDDVAYLLTWALVETRQVIERQYQHLPPDRSPLTYPLIPSRMATPSVPLHPAAEQYYREAGHLPS